METTTVEQILADIVSAKKSGKWLSCTYRINTDKGIFSLGVKCFGLWCQRMEICGMADSVPEQKTIKSFKQAFTDTVDSLVRCL